MPTRIRTVRSLPYLVPLLLACTALLILTAYLLGGSPTARPRQSPTSLTAGTASAGGIAGLMDPEAGETSGADGTPGEGNALPPITWVVIDAGHGGEDGGASSAAGTSEKALNLSVALALRDLFEAAGIPVVMTRTEDVLLYDRNVDFKGRKKVLDLAARRLVAEKTAATAARSGGTCLLLSIHMNAFPQTQYSGMQVWYATADSRCAEIAGELQTASLTLMPKNHRKTKAADSGIYLLHRASFPAILVECGFLSNPEEAARLAEEPYRHALAVLIFTAIAPHLSPP